MIDTKALKSKILDLAISGKLTEQLPEDGTAEELYAQIQEEKAKLVAEGKRKKEKQLPPIMEDEIPFDIPKNWKWVRLESIGYFISGYTPKPSELYSEGKYPYYKVANMNIEGNEVYLNHTDLYLLEDTKKVFEKGTIVYPKNGGAVFTNKKRILANDSVVDLNTGGFSSYGFIELMYLYYFFTLLDFSDYAKGSSVPTLDMSGIKNIPFPLPPLAEQKRIAEVVEDAFAVIVKLDKAQEDYKADQEILRKKVIDAGIQGKLTEQLPEDGTAEELYGQIQEEKARLIAEGKIKKEKPLPPITEEEIPFEIPEKWKWVRLGDISSYGVKVEKIQPCNMLPEQWLLELEDVEAGGRLLQKTRVKDRIPKGEKVVFAKGNILYSKLRPYLKKVLIADDDGIATPEIIPFKSYAGTEHGYIKECLVSTYFDKTVNQRSFGVKMPRVDTEFMRSMLIPLPPLTEQYRIVEKIETILRCIS